MKVRLNGTEVEVGSSAVLAVAPVLMPVRGGWLALSAPGSILHIGVLGVTEAEARDQFQAALQEWGRLYEEA